jgi:hypothetical protein
VLSVWGHATTLFDLGWTVAVQFIKLSGQYRPHPVRNIDCPFVD